MKLSTYCASFVDVAYLEIIEEIFSRYVYMERDFLVILSLMIRNLGNS